MTEGFFQFQARQTAAKAEARVPVSKPADPRPMSVSQLTSLIGRVLKKELPALVTVRGEISNFKLHRPSGNLYFTLKDTSACIGCVMWKDAASRLKFQCTDGLEMLATGYVSIYADQGKYQLYVSMLAPLGKGALELAFQQLRARLQQEGLFAAERKKPLPPYPRRIALVTSGATAALQDMLKVLRRFPWLKLMLYDVPVQGDGAAPRIAAALRHLSERHERIGGVDAILLARGGGSLEDLWPFNEEVVARAIAASRIPIVTGVGHEVDVSIADLVADHHAHTPTEAAQTITAPWRNIGQTLDAHADRLRRQTLQSLRHARQRLTMIQRHELFRRPADRIATYRQKLDDRQRSLLLRVTQLLNRGQARVDRLETRLSQRHPRHSIALHRAKLLAAEKQLASATSAYQRRLAMKLDAMQKHLAAIGPEQVLRRGYTITMDAKTGQPLRSAAAVAPNARLITRFSDGKVESIAEDPRQPRLF